MVQKIHPSGHFFKKIKSAECSVHLYSSPCTGHGSSSLFGCQNIDDTRSVIGDHAFESFEKGILADLFPSTTGTGNEDKLLEDFAEINANSSGIR